MVLAVDSPASMTTVGRGPSPSSWPRRVSKRTLGLVAVRSGLVRRLGGRWRRRHAAASGKQGTLDGCSGLEHRGRLAAARAQTTREEGCLLTGAEIRRCNGPLGSSLAGMWGECGGWGLAAYI